MKKLKRIITSLLTLVFALNAFSQSFILGCVQDAFLKYPLPEAKVSLLLATDSTVVIDSIPIRKKYNEDGTIKKAEFSIKVERKTCNYLLRARLDGYEDGYQSLSIDGNNERFWVMDDPLELRKVRQINLDGITVTATKVKMYYKGDTLVYDATAFKLPDGSMLDDLIRQMPGVTMNDNGEIFVNGRKIDELQLGSRSFMRGNSKVMLENLPYYTVKDIKVYEQETDLNRAANAQLEKKKFVMDVNLKPEYQRGYIANVEAAGGTEERWLGRAFLLSFAKNTRYTLSANSNNVNESRHIGSTDHWTPDAVPKSLLTTNSVASEIDYQTTDKNVQENLRVDFTTTRNKGEMMKHSELFLPENPLQAIHQNSLTKENLLKIGNRFKYINPQNFLFESEVALNYKSYSGNSSMLTEQYVDTLITRQRNSGFNDGKTWAAKVYARIAPTLKKRGNWDQYFRFTTHLDYTSDENQHAQHFHVKDFTNPSSVDSYNSNDYSMRKIAVQTPIWYALPRRMNFMDIEVAPSYSREKTHDWLYHPDTLMLPSQIDMLQAVTDRANSYDSELQSLGGYIRLHYFRSQILPATNRMPKADVNFLNFYLELKPTYERLHYQRGLLDTLATRKTLRFNPWLDIDLYVKKNYFRPVTIRISYYESNSALINQINFRDDATPLVVRLGNPNLKPWFAQSSISATYKDLRAPRHNYTLSARYNYVHNNVSQSVCFNPLTGVYTYRPENIHGTYDINVDASIFYTLDADRQWTMENKSDGHFTHWLDHVMLSGETESQLNAVNTLTLHDGAYIQYNKGALNIRATGDITWRHSEGKMRDFETLNVTDFKYGLSARYTIPKLKTTIFADGNMYSRRGYGSAELNTDDFVLNASISQPFMKGKLIARIEAFDILHQLSSTQYQVNAQGRIETWYRSLPHYFMAHIVYHFNKNPRKK